MCMEFVLVFFKLFLYGDVEFWLIWLRVVDFIRSDFCRLDFYWFVGSLFLYWICWFNLYGEEIVFNLEFVLSSWRDWYEVFIFDCIWFSVV